MSFMLLFFCQKYVGRYVDEDNTDSIFM
jgi:hypothetical protein